MDCGRLMTWYAVSISMMTSPNGEKNPRYWPFVQGIHRSPVNSPHKVQWRGALMLSLICAWINGWVNNRQACDLRSHRGHYDITVLPVISLPSSVGPVCLFNSNCSSLHLQLPQHVMRVGHQPSLLIRKLHTLYINFLSSRWYGINLCWACVVIQNSRWDLMVRRAR